MTTRLKLCPFCKGDAFVRTANPLPNSWKCTAIYQDCGARVVAFGRTANWTHALAVRRWNRRVQ